MRAVAEGYIEMNHRDVMRVVRIVDHDPTIPAVMSACSSCILEGGIVFVYKGRHQYKNMKTHHADHAWQMFTKSLLRSLWTFGIAPIVIQKPSRTSDVDSPETQSADIAEFTMSGCHRPMVLDIRYLKVMYKVDDYGVPSYLFYHDRSTATVESVSNSAFDKPLDVVAVFELDRPDPYGRLTSKVSRLVGTGERVQRILAMQEATMRALADPPLLLERIPTSADPSAGLLVPRPDSVLSAVPSADGFSIETAGDDEAAHAIELSRIVETANTGMRLKHQLANHATPVRLPHNTKVARPTPPAESKYTSEIQVMFEEQIAVVFGFPRSLWAQSHNTRYASSPEALRFFNVMKNDLKQLILPMLRIVYGHVMGRYMNDMDPIDDHERVATLVDPADVSICLPGVPGVDELRALWVERVLTTEAYIRHTGSVYGLEESDFRSPAEIDKERAEDRSASLTTPDGSRRADSKPDRKDAEQAIAKKRKREQPDMRTM